MPTHAALLNMHAYGQPRPASTSELPTAEHSGLRSTTWTVAAQHSASASGHELRAGSSTRELTTAGNTCQGLCECDHSQATKCDSHRQAPLHPGVMELPALPSDGSATWQGCCSAMCAPTHATLESLLCDVQCNKLCVQTGTATLAAAFSHTHTKTGNGPLRHPLLCVCTDDGQWTKQVPGAKGCSPLSKASARGSFLPRGRQLCLHQPWKPPGCSLSQVRTTATATHTHTHTPNLQGHGLILSPLEVSFCHQKHRVAAQGGRPGL